MELFAVVLAFVAFGIAALIAYLRGKRSITREDVIYRIRRDVNMAGIHIEEAKDTEKPDQKLFHLGCALESLTYASEALDILKETK